METQPHPDAGQDAAIVRVQDDTLALDGDWRTTGEAARNVGRLFGEGDVSIRTQALNEAAIRHWWKVSGIEGRIAQKSRRHDSGAAITWEDKAGISQRYYLSSDAVTRMREAGSDASRDENDAWISP